jgi:hypothetical protein
MFGSPLFFLTEETMENQARLEYYDSPAKRKKHGFFSSPSANWHWAANQGYWTNHADSSVPDLFYCVGIDGYDVFSIAGIAGGVAPAFCVKQGSSLEIPSPLRGGVAQSLS